MAVFKAVAAGHGEVSEERENEIRGIFLEEFHQLAPLLKHELFKEEAEWRIVSKHANTYFDRVNSASAAAC